MSVRMYHPLNGWTHAYTPQEVERLTAQGWIPEPTPTPEPRKKLSPKDKK